MGSDGKVHWAGHTASLDTHLKEAIDAAADRKESKEVVQDQKKSKTE